MNIAFIKREGLSYGGCEKYARSFAKILAEDHKIDYYYTNNIILNSDYETKKDLDSYNINCIRIDTDNTDIVEWKNSNLFDKFNENKYDVAQAISGGCKEYPWDKLNFTKIIHSIHGVSSYNKPNIVKCILLCKWQTDIWIQNGGDSSKVEIIPSIVEVPQKSNENFRKELNIPEDAFVYGFHQRNEIGLFSSIPLESFKYINNAYFLIMGGSEAHKNYVIANNIKNVIFIEHSPDTKIIHKFLQTLDCYAHGKSCGEVCSACIIEAMYHGLPVISHPGKDMGHLEMIDTCGKMAYSLEDYVTEMKLLQSNKNYLQYKIGLTLDKYKNNYNFNTIKSKIKDIYRKI